jgi:hypothetical protein
MPNEPENHEGPEIIHAIHGVTAAGDWFLFADVAARPAAERDRTKNEQHFDESWLVVLGRRDRDIITLQGKDA